jgi:gag-polypeptide of LTR copia-type
MTTATTTTATIASTSITSSKASSTGDTSIRVIVFSGKRDDWESWKVKFTVKAAIRGYEGVLLGEDPVPKTHDVTGTKKTLTADEQVIATANKTGYGDLILSIDCSTAAGKVAFAAVKGAKTKEVPGGDLRAAYLRLKTKYEPSTTPQLMQLTREFHSKSLQSGHDPDVYITNLEAIKVQMAELDHEINEKSLILHILNNLNDDYEMEVKMLEHRMQRLKDEGKEMSIEEVRIELNLRYERLKQSNKKVDHAYYMGTTFKGKCHWCGKIGHKSTECRTRITGKPQSNGYNNNSYNNNNNNRNTNNRNGHGNGNNQPFSKRQNSFCTHCNIKGHDVSECRKKNRESNGEKMTMAKEFACMARDLSKRDILPKLGICMECEAEGIAFTECKYCDADSGMYYVPVTRTTYDQFITTGDITDPRTANDDIDNDNIDPFSDNEGYITLSDCEEGITSDTDLKELEQVDVPQYQCFKNKLIGPSYKSFFYSASVTTMFKLVHTHVDEVGLAYTTDEYATKRTQDMKHFGFKTIPSILNNLDNLNFNVTLHNMYYAPLIVKEERPPLIDSFTPIELMGITRFGIHTFDEYTKSTVSSLQQTKIPDDTPDRLTKPSALTRAEINAILAIPTEPNIEPTEFCFAMTGKKWNFHQKTVRSHRDLHQRPHKTPVQHASPIAKAFNMHGSRRHIWLGDSHHHTLPMMIPACSNGRKYMTPSKLGMVEQFLQLKKVTLA